MGTRACWAWRRRGRRRRGRCRRRGRPSTGRATARSTCPWRTWSSTRCMCVASPGAARRACVRRVRRAPRALQDPDVAAVRLPTSAAAHRHRALGARSAVRGVSSASCESINKLSFTIRRLLAARELLRPAWPCHGAELRCGPCHAGTYAGLVEKLPYLQALGINAIELLPIHEYNELEYYQVRATPGESVLTNVLALLPGCRTLCV